MNSVIEYIRSRHATTKWPYYCVNKTFYALRQHNKEDLRNEIKQLKKDGIITIVPYLNGWLIELKQVT